MSKGSGPAYPQMHTVIDRDDADCPTVVRRINGLSKREEFAKAAMQGILAGPAIRQFVLDYGAGKEAEKALAQSCVQFADALLTELEKGKSE